MSLARIGVIGGSGLYEMEGFEGRRETTLDTPFGAPSDPFVTGRLEGREVVFLSRHGRGHRVSPSEINYRANVWGMKQLGVEFLLSNSACGSLKQEIVPGDFVIVDQHIDRTKGRDATFFGDGVVVHVMFADPVTLSFAAAGGRRGEVGRRSTAAERTCMEGPRSPRARRVVTGASADVIADESHRGEAGPRRDGFRDAGAGHRLRLPVRGHGDVSVRR
jgi:5'-methylthioadenosine phosphorylase